MPVQLGQRFALPGIAGQQARVLVAACCAFCPALPVSGEFFGQGRSVGTDSFREVEAGAQRWPHHAVGDRRCLVLAGPVGFRYLGGGLAGPGHEAGRVAVGGEKLGVTGKVLDRRHLVRHAAGRGILAASLVQPPVAVLLRHLFQVLDSVAGQPAQPGDREETSLGAGAQGQRFPASPGQAGDPLMVRCAERDHELADQKPPVWSRDLGEIPVQFAWVDLDRGTLSPAQVPPVVVE